MRLLSFTLILLATPMAASQAPPTDKSELEIVLETPDGYLVVPGHGYKARIENGAVYVPPEILKDEKLMDNLRKRGLTPIPGLPPTPNSAPACRVDYSDIDAEQKASDERLRRMRRREEVIPLQHQYEQELYFRDRREKRYEEKCGKRQRSGSDQRILDMTLKACKAIEVECKPVKHW